MLLQLAWANYAKRKIKVRKEESLAMLEQLTLAFKVIGDGRFFKKLIHKLMLLKIV